MDVKIKMEVEPDPVSSADLGSLGDLLTSELGRPTVSAKADPEVGIKDGGLTIALTLVGLALSAISTTITVINYWKSTRPRYTVSVATTRDISIALDMTEFQIADLVSTDASADLVISIARSNDNEA